MHLLSPNGLPLCAELPTAVAPASKFTLSCSIITQCRDNFGATEASCLECVGAGSYNWRWDKSWRVLKLSVPAICGFISVGLQGAGLVYTTGALMGL